MGAVLWVAPWELKREDGANPSRTRRCNRGQTPHEPTVGSQREGAVDRMIRKPEDLPMKNKGCRYPSGTGEGGKIQSRIENGIPGPTMGLGIFYWEDSPGGERSQPKNQLRRYFGRKCEASAAQRLYS